MNFDLILKFKCLFQNDFQMVLVVESNESCVCQDIVVEMQKKPGKGLGLSVVGRKDGKGVFISDMVSLIKILKNF